MNLKVFGRKFLSLHDQNICLEFASRKETKNVWKGRLPVEIRTEHLPNKSEERYRKSNPLFLLLENMCGQHSASECAPLCSFPFPPSVPNVFRISLKKYGRA
jgi:hypothetical protein